MYKLNYRSRKTVNYKTPYAVFFGEPARIHVMKIAKYTYT